MDSGLHHTYVFTSTGLASLFGAGTGGGSFGTTPIASMSSRPTAGPSGWTRTSSRTYSYKNMSCHRSSCQWASTHATLEKVQQPHILVRKSYHQRSSHRSFLEPEALAKHGTASRVRDYPRVICILQLIESVMKRHHSSALYLDFVPRIVLQAVRVRFRWRLADTHEQQCWLDLELRPIVSDHPLQYFRVHQRSIEESGRHGGMRNGSCSRVRMYTVDTRSDKGHEILLIMASARLT